MTLATRTSHAGGLPLLRGSLRIVSAVQELATAHGEELELDGWDAEEGGHVGHQISGTSTCDIVNEGRAPLRLYRRSSFPGFSQMRLESVSTLSRR